MSNEDEIETEARRLFEAYLNRYPSRIGITRPQWSRLVKSARDKWRKRATQNLKRN